MRASALGPALAWALLLAGGTASAAPIEPPLVLYAAGSTTGALGAMVRRYTAETGQAVTLRTGPAGLMRERIEQGDKVDLFVSADMAHPERLTARHLAGPTVLFARNTLCVSALPAVGLTRANLLDRLLDPKVRIGTSTPKADPGGDYAMALFDKAESVRPGAAARLKAKARQVVGGSIEPPPAAGAPKRNARDAMLQRNVDVSIGYCSARETTPDTSVDKVALPPALAIDARYGMAILTTSHDPKREAAAGQLALYLLSPAAQRLLVPYGFLPANAPAP